MEEIGELCRRRFEDWELEESIIQEVQPEPTPGLSQISYPSNIPVENPLNSQNHIVYNKLQSKSQNGNTS